MSANEGRKTSTSLLNHAAAGSSQTSVGLSAHDALCVPHLRRPRQGMDPPPVPLSQFVLKVYSRCDLACDHCYVYEPADRSWRGRPMVNSDQVAAQAACRQYPATLRCERSRLP